MYRNYNEITGNLELPCHNEVIRATSVCQGRIERGIGPTYGSSNRLGGGGRLQGERGSRVRGRMTAAGKR